MASTSAHEIEEMIAFERIEADDEKKAYEAASKSSARAVEEF